MIKLIMDTRTEKEKQKLLEEAMLREKEKRKNRKVDTNRVTGS